MPPINSYGFSSVMKKAFNEAKNEDAEEVRKSCSEGKEYSGRFYALSKAWMTSFLGFIDYEHSQPGMICNDHLIARIVTVDAIPVDDEPSKIEDDMFAVDDLKGTTIDKVLNDIEKYPNILTKGLVVGKDYVLVGEAVWTLISSKFGYDQLLSFEARFLTTVEKQLWFYKSTDMSDLIVEVYPWDQTNTSIADSLVPIPLSGLFNYSAPEANALSRLISDYADTDDLVPCEKTEISVNDEAMPVLLLPPSTTGQVVNEESSFRHGDVESFPSLRKRKRYGAGLGNLGNTCFMNSTLQCLAHTLPLRQYFLSGQFRDDLNRENPLGTGGELAIEFAKLLQEMWGLSSDNFSDRNPLSSYSSNYKWYTSPSISTSHSAVVYPSSFKHALGKHAERFMGYDQHDSQELATFLLDALHEDTNRVTKKPYIENPEQGDMETDDEAAAKSWALHLKRENSQVLESFMGQVKSRVECPHPGCGRVSTTFDPCMYLSVPIPGATTRIISFVYVPLDASSRAKDLSVVVGKSANIVQLREAVAILINTLSFEEPVKVEDIIITEVFSSEVYTFFSDNVDISMIRDSDKVYVYRVIPMSKLSNDSSVTLSEPPHLGLDESVITELTTDDKWRSVLENYVRQPKLLVHLFHPRSTMEERVDFLESVRSLLERCFSCPECVAYRLSAEKKINFFDKNSKLDGTNSFSAINTLKSSTDEADISEAISVEERCCNSKTFKNIRSAADVATLEFCSRKFYQLCKEIDAPGEIQVTFTKPYRFSLTNFRNDDTFGFPLVLRISSSLTVYGLRKILADRLSASMHRKTRDDEKNDHPMQDEDHDSLNGYDPDYFRMSEDKSASPNALDIMRQVHLQYGRHNASNYYRTLGTTFSSDDKYMPTTQRLASPDDEAEQKYVLDIVGNQGKVQVFFPAHIYRENIDIRLMFKVESGRSIQDSDYDHQRTTVLQCIRKYCQKEQLEETDMWYCDRCKEHVPAWKQIGLYRLPPILIIHLKRFQFSVTSHRRSKIETPIDFPLVGLDLREEAKHWSNGEEPIYDCYALTNHFGGLGGGHYTAFAQNDEGEWCGFDDSRVTTGLSANSVVTSAAYVLYYKRRDVLLPVESVLIENPPFVMDVYDDKLSNNEISMGISSPSVDVGQQDTSSLENEPADDRDDSILDTSNYAI